MMSALDSFSDSAWTDALAMAELLSERGIETIVSRFFDDRRWRYYWPATDRFVAIPGEWLTDGKRSKKEIADEIEQSLRHPNARNIL